MHIRPVLSAELSGIQRESKHKAQKKKLESSFSLIQQDNISAVMGLRKDFLTKDSPG